MIFRQIYEDGLAQASYFFGCPATGEAMVIDPRRDIDVYLQLAQETKLNIVAVGETHISTPIFCLAHANWRTPQAQPSTSPTKATRTGNTEG
ncbi:MAG: hypothetical protein KatS3mg016_1858 [Fimbriimonadales bacterium]|nr:MAG: hypothetical protein KatS3mg016_1858 [Fimbriimonadales bacterium]